MQEIAQTHGGVVSACEKKEYGHAEISILESGKLFKGLPNPMTVWMSHGDQISSLPSGFRTVASTGTAPFAAIDNEKERIYGIQFHPEVTHTTLGAAVLKNFVIEICSATSSWTMESLQKKKSKGSVRSLVLLLVSLVLFLGV